jgi:hypothetical protein
VNTTPRAQQQEASGWAAAAGVVAVGAGLALGELAAGFLSPSVSPVTAVGGAVIDGVPPAVKDWAIGLFGTADKLALLVGMGLVIAALAALAGMAELRRRFAGTAIIAVFGAVGVVAVLGRSERTVDAVPVPVLAAVVGMILLRWLVRRLEEWRTRAGTPPAASGSARRAPASAAPGGAAPAGMPCRVLRRGMPCRELPCRVLPRRRSRRPGAASSRHSAEPPGLAWLPACSPPQSAAPPPP